MSPGQRLGLGPPNEPTSPERASEPHHATHGGLGEVRRGRRRVHDVGVSFAVRPPFQGWCPSTGRRPGVAPGSPRMPRWGGSDRSDGAGDCGGRKAGSRPGPLAWRPWHAASSSPLDVTPLPTAQPPFLGSCEATGGGEAHGGRTKPCRPTGVVRETRTRALARLVRAGDGQARGSVRRASAGASRRLGCLGALGERGTVGACGIRG